jgi:hypothetical protein
LAGASLGGYLLFRPRPAAPTSTQDRDAVEQVAGRFAQAMRGGKAEEFRSFLTLKARSNAKQADAGASQARQVIRPGATYEVAAPVITGDTAQVALVLREAGAAKDVVLRLRREEEQWRVCGMGFSLPLPGEPRLDIDFENNRLGGDVGEGFSRMGQEMEKGFQKLGAEMEKNVNDALTDTKPQEAERAADTFRSMDRKEFEAAWQQPLEVKDRPAGQVLRDLAEKWGMQLKLTELQEQRVVGRPITLQLQGRSRWEILEEVCRKVGQYPVFNRETNFFGGGVTQVLSLNPLPRSLPVAFAGPFRVEVMDVSEFAPQATGLLQVQVAAERLPVRQDLQGHSPITWTAITAADGTDLWDKGGPMPRLNAAGPTFLPLKNLLRGVTSVLSCRGAAHVMLPAKVEVLRFENPQAGAIQKTGPITVTLKEAQKGENTMTYNGQPRKSPWHRFRFEVKGAPYERLLLAAYDKQQRLLARSPGGMDMRQTMGDVSTFGYTSAGEAAVVVVKVVTEVQDLAYEFQLENIPLRHAAERPVKLEPARFTGHAAPATVELAAVSKERGFPKLRLRAVNHSDKDIRALEMTLTFLSNGKSYQSPAAYKPRGSEPIWDMTHGRQVAKWESNPMPIAVARQATVEFEPTSWSNPPKEVKGTTVRVERVEFTDGSEWKAE